MGKNSGSFDGVKPDELKGGILEPFEIFNITVGTDTTVARGELLAATDFSATFSLATASDTAKVFAVAVENFTADSDSAVTQAYVRGTFNREKIKPTDTAILTALEPALRRQNILLTALLPNNQPQF